MSRVTFKDADRAGWRLADALGLPYGHYVTVEEEPLAFDGERPEGRFKRPLSRTLANTRQVGWVTTQPGAIQVDYNAAYGGCIIEQIAHDGGTWVNHPFKRERVSPREFVLYVEALLEGMDLANTEKRLDRFYR